ncbi:hypothetical protein ASPZODRAFT_1344699 [Penicilliopsis zonata CBS 506.65]|uniref:DUF300 domain protein n=1 Tax=Penicilliopsis zonata CBS 506.65 TaxID=1073090 RepID=A0A1L9SNU3_9EURO|nr:hypothetical protein ASPZODRAFT_1344699 [Penicilliopsis zonata CBS 506.65]OJJ48905.1 hypothetical protein ASPZODRAFT_1344699 [Penicilliopsis zonata CBS 506.65]
MGWPVCNSTLENESISETPLWTDGLTYHKLSVLIGLALGIFSVVVSGGLIMLHATHYSKPTEQRYIIRILFMVPIYSLVAFLSLYYYRDAVYYEVLGDCYEAFAISAFFTLLCQYIAPDLHSQKEYFRGIKPKQWVWPIPWLQRCWGGENGIWRIPRSGLTWFNVIWAGVFQYCFLRVLMTIVAVVTQAFNVYCEESLNPAFSHIWVLCIESVCVTIAMYCLIQFYIQVMNDIAQYEPLLKIVSIKLVIFLSFWQSTVISFLVSAGAVKASKTIQMQDLKVGIPNLLIAIEMAIFAVLHWWAFPWRPYVSGHPNGSEVTDLYGNGHVVYQGGLFGMKALVDASNPWDLFKATGRGFRWLFVGRKRRTMDPSYQNQSDSISLKPAESASETNLANSGVTAYGGAGMSAAQRSRYGTSPPNEEGEVLLAHAQPNPTSYSIQSTGDLGMVPQSYDSDRSVLALPGHISQS